MPSLGLSGPLAALVATVGTPAAWLSQQESTAAWILPTQPVLVEIVADLPSQLLGLQDWARQGSMKIELRARVGGVANSVSHCPQPVAALRAGGSWGEH
jgi:hypothetical protein